MKKIVLAIMTFAAFLPGLTAADGDPLYFQGLISFRNGPDPAGKTPVYWATKRKLHRISGSRAAELKFGANWVSQIRWCGDSSSKPLSGYCSTIYNKFQRGNDVTEYSKDLFNL
jgi:hypothetical protein